MLHSLVRLPRNRRPAEWDKIDDPVYGHPSAGFGNANWNVDYSLKIVRKVISWECLFFHRWHHNVGSRRKFSSDVGKIAQEDIH